MFVETKEAGEVAEAPAKVLKISEAIRIGARIRPQCRGLLYSGGRSCAIGAALEARGGDLQSIMDARPELFNKLVRALVPELRDVHGSDLWVQIGIRNDEGWTRERIADWLEERGY